MLVGFGGLLGSICRYLIAIFFTRHFSSVFPYGTFIVNIFGCLLIGIFYGLSEQFDWFTPSWRIFLATGFCGGFTTFSSFAYENINLLQTSEYLMFATYSIGSFVLGLLSAFAGVVLVKMIAS